MSQASEREKRKFKLAYDAGYQAAMLAAAARERVLRGALEDAKRFIENDAKHGYKHELWEGRSPTLMSIARALSATPAPGSERVALALRVLEWAEHFEKTSPPEQGMYGATVRTERDKAVENTRWCLASALRALGVGAGVVGEGEDGK